MNHSEETSDRPGPYPSLIFDSLAATGIQGIEDATKVFSQFAALLDPMAADKGHADGSTAATSEPRPPWQQPNSGTHSGPQQSNASEAGDGGRTGAISPGELRALVTRLGDTYLNIVVKMIDSSFDAYATRARLGPTMDGGASPAVILRRNGDGTTVGNLYLHNHEQDPTEQLVLVATDLSSSNGDRVPAEQLRIEPATVERIEPGATASVRISLEETALAGVHPAAILYGHVLLADHPEAGVPLRVFATGHDRVDGEEGR